MFRFAQHDSATSPWALIQVRLLDRNVELSSLLEQDALNELRNNRSDLHLHVPLLSGDPGVHRHVLHRELKLDWETPKLHHLAQTKANGDRPDIRRGRSPVCQNITRV